MRTLILVGLCLAVGLPGSSAQCGSTPQCCPDIQMRIEDEELEEELFGKSDPNIEYPPLQNVRVFDTHNELLVADPLYPSNTIDSISSVFELDTYIDIASRSEEIEIFDLTTDNEGFLLLTGDNASVEIKSIDSFTQWEFVGLTTWRAGEGVSVTIETPAESSSTALTKNYDDTSHSPPKMAGLPGVVKSDTMKIKVENGTSTVDGHQKPKVKVLAKKSNKCPNGTTVRKTEKPIKNKHRRSARITSDKWYFESLRDDETVHDVCVKVKALRGDPDVVLQLGCKAPGHRSKYFTFRVTPTKKPQYFCMHQIPSDTMDTYDQDVSLATLKTWKKNKCSFMLRLAGKKGAGRSHITAEWGDAVMTSCWDDQPPQEPPQE